MSKKIIFLFASVSFFLGSNIVRAEVVINEIQVLPTTHKFFELYNNGSSAVSLTGWHVKKKTASGTESSLVVASRLDGKSVPANGYFLITNEEGYSGGGSSDAGWPQSNTGVASNNTIIIFDSNGAQIDKVGWGEASDCSNPCPANPSSEQSLSRTSSGSWITATPTPGSANQSSTQSAGSTGSSDPEDKEENETTKVATSSSSSSSTKTKTEVTVNLLAYAGIPHLFQGRAVTSGGAKPSHGRYFWNFGDGSSREVKVVNVDKFTHTFFYPGEYTVLFEYYPDFFADIPEAKERVTIRVEEPTVSISRLGDASDFFIELSNDAAYAVDISNWSILSDWRAFKLPRNTILGASKKMIISPKVTNFSIADRDSLRLSTGEGELVSDYRPVALALAEPPKLSTQHQAQTSPAVDRSIGADTASAGAIGAGANSVLNLPALVSTRVAEYPILTEEVQANAGASVEAGDSIIPFVASFAFIGGSACAVYFIRRKRVIQKPGDDFEILSH